MVGGNGTFSSTKSQSASSEITTNRKFLKIEPNMGYFFMDKFAAGVKGLLNYEKVSYTQNNNSSSTYFGIGPYARYYFLSVDKQLNVFSEGSYEHYIYKPGNGNSNNYSLLIGSVMYFNSSVGIEFTAGYSVTKNSNELTYKAFQFGLGLQIHLQKE